MLKWKERIYKRNEKVRRERDREKELGGGEGDGRKGEGK